MSGEEEFVELKVTAKVPQPVYNFLKDYYALAGRQVEEALTKEFETAVIDWTEGIVDDLEDRYDVRKKYDLNRFLDC